MPYSTLFSNNQIIQLFKNNKTSLELNIFQPNFQPLALLFAERLNYKFLITQLDERCPKYAFGLSDYGNGSLAIEVFDIDKMETELCGKGDVLKSDATFVSKYNLVIYAKVADYLGEIVTDDKSEKAKPLFERFNKLERYRNPNKNMRSFRFDCI